MFLYLIIQILVMFDKLLKEEEDKLKSLIGNVEDLKEIILLINNKKIVSDSRIKLIISNILEFFKHNENVSIIYTKILKY